MSKPIQIGIAAALVAASVLTILAFGGDVDEASQAGDSEMEGHDHAAMLAGLEEAQPVSLSADLLARAGVTYARVERRPLTRRVTSLGRVVSDETRLADVTPKLEGWVEKLYVDFTGAPVRAGEPLFEFYSPVLISAQEELILAARLMDAAEQGTDRARSAQSLLESSRRRLAYWDVPAEVIQQIEASKEVRRTVPILAPASGTVMEKSVVEGGRVTPGTRLYRIADLSWIWIEADVFERDLGLVANGRHAMMTLEAYPGETFHGEVTFVYPTLDRDTRTGMVRVEVPNSDLRLRPGMFASVDFLVPTPGPVLVVPRGALLATGERTLVFVQEANGTLVPREVVPGLATGQEIEVLSGLGVGEVVVSSATFLIDAESNLGSAATNLGGGAGGEVGDMEGMDHSQHQMGEPVPDTAGVDMEGMDHSQHQMGEPVPDTAGVDMEGMDHSQHQMGEPAPDTSGTGTGHSGNSNPQGS